MLHCKILPGKLVAGLVPNHRVKFCNLWINNGILDHYSHISSHIIGSLLRTVVRFGRFIRPERMQNPSPNLYITEATTAGSTPDTQEALVQHRGTRPKAMCNLNWSITANFHEGSEVGQSAISMELVEQLALPNTDDGPLGCIMATTLEGRICLLGGQIPEVLTFAITRTRFANPFSG